MAPDRPSPPSDNTTHLARRARDGDRPSFGALYERLAPALFAWSSLRIRASMRGRLDPEDVIQEVWMRAREKFAAFDPERMPFRAWVLAVAKNVLHESVRRLRRPDAGTGADLAVSQADPLHEIPAAVTSISRRAASDEQIHRFVARVGRLSEDDRMLIIYCGLEGQTCAKTATRLGLSTAAVIKRWQRLRKELDEKGLPAELLDDSVN